MAVNSSFRCGRLAVSETEQPMQKIQGTAVAVAARVMSDQIRAAEREMQVGCFDE
jgi:hypothetical protein